MRGLRPGSNDFRDIPSLQTGKIYVSKKSCEKYTGDQLIGVATMHKSNAVPVTKDSDMAVAISKMRRN